MVLIDEILFAFAPMAMPKYEGSKANDQLYHKSLSCILWDS